MLTKESDNMRVAIYIRVSTLDQAREGYSLTAEHVHRAFIEFVSLYGTVKAARAAGIRGKLSGQMPA